jgi:hypothetical protein
MGGVGGGGDSPRPHGPHYPRECVKIIGRSPVHRKQAPPQGAAPAQATDSGAVRGHLLETRWRRGYIAVAVAAIAAGAMGTRDTVGSRELEPHSWNSRDWNR